MYGAIIGYEGLITKEPVKVYTNEENLYVFENIDFSFFNTPSDGLSTDNSYTYFISSHREVELFIEGIKTAFKVIREITN